MKAIYKRELRSYFTSMIGCAFAAVLTVIGGVYFMVYNLTSGYPYFSYSLSGVIFAVLITVPVLSMKCFAEERKNKTDQLLLTSPVPLTKIILGKYFAMITVFAIPCLIYCLFPLIIKFQGNAHLLVDYSSILAFYLLGCVFIGIGMYMLDNLLNYVPTSALSGVIITILFLSLAAGLIYHITKNQIIAGIAEIAGLVLSIAVYFIKSSVFENFIHDILEHFVLTGVFYNFAQNYIFDIGGLLYYLSVIILFIFLTVQAFQKRRWS